MKPQSKLPHIAIVSESELEALAAEERFRAAAPPQWFAKKLQSSHPSRRNSR
jgi:hypothetical protein